MSDFVILPAIDLKDGQCVRLRQGRADDVKVYGHDPAAQAADWARQGAQWLHVVDLDGAFQGRPVHGAVIAAMVQAAGIPVECGGGLRRDEDIETLLACGVRRAILGTRALEDMAALAQLAAKYGDRLAVGIDARNGLVQVKGWTETSRMTAVELARRAAASGIKTIIYTDTATDGMLQGPNISGVAEMCDVVGPGCMVIASGGITTAADIRRLRAQNKANLGGAIVGKALYEGRTTLAELQAAAS
ncbi:MAG TPA: 1-(5-phosphoribosyl)-5-[(5-phosphoribosylamino)methylideneamino]imidazole-4-carboxamide isomerase [Kiritimatiellia bacterium]|jgi:phosphoribosylformimino-5-aminoimidazole carboxamide ribotide isomerase|nr:1-(5-phosphoribosyl)-5-[(5-phosphoribosylamino)methylideneamino]imidazole-4-carboxamide isomerase [Kiritimatiellia bacterium]OQC59541.1 MAG: 1-(5-phosphoribosyl)-5-((5-phosphoribosylamino)methylideneamino) imidazole-4-carboxamide isomerase [Verrucomicrobia bacterium ADurb.Bin018]HOE00382.1 1-(5-phosphoribosyl)-5-[(5-phosphoribosylamino)methylideneamino]imidazole-4-carboxamide isomerase [Kiritimatiellia bacterium]HOE37070.1 1-(5-phosphoribosyl)-5-[(5-phosphoribosylamino)methylideneamino]imidaz